MMCALAQQYLPGQELNEKTLGTAVFLDKHYWESHEQATANAIAKALSG